MPETFFISLLGLDGILKRAAFKDTVLFKEHNPKYMFNHILVASGICFNLFSEFGIGKKLEPLLLELFKNHAINPITNNNNIFFQELVNLALEIAIVIREDNIRKEAIWSYDYAIKSLSKIDELSAERFERLYALFNFEDEQEQEYGYNEQEEYLILEEYNLIEDNIEDNIDEDIENNIDEEDIIDEEDNIDEQDDINMYLEFCFCEFCKEFRKYHYYRNENIEQIILTVLNEINRTANEVY